MKKPKKPKPVPKAPAPPPAAQSPEEKRPFPKTPGRFPWKPLLGIFLVLAFATAGWWTLRGVKNAAILKKKKPRVETVKPAFFHHEFAEWTLKTDSLILKKHLRDKTLWTWVERGTVPVTTVGERVRFPLIYDKTAGVWHARWPVPWNAPADEYRIRLDTAPFAGWPLPGEKSFRVKSRRFTPMPEGFGVLTMENLANLQNIPGPDGARGIESLAEWADFIGADALWIQGAESSGYNAIPPDDFPWHVQPEKNLRALGAECRRRGLKLGVYELSYLVGGPPKFTPRYEYGWHYDKGRVVHGLDLVKRRGISIADPKRPGDIANVLSRWNKLPEVDFLGLDYIRPAFGGFELVDDFVKEMKPPLPAGWGKMTKQERMLWLTQHKFLGTLLRDKQSERYRVTEMWFWYRAHRTAQMVEKILTPLGTEKPVWAFTLSWQKGWEHGQDPVMMRDAGIDMDAIMLYEADGPMFRGLVKHWNSYAPQKDLNLLVGDVIDWNLHQKTRNPAGPEDYMARNMTAVKGFHKDGPVRGLFIHDFYRARRGRLGPYGTKEWLLAGGACLTELRRLHGKLPYEAELSVATAAAAGVEMRGTVQLKTPPQSPPVEGTFFSSPDIRLEPRTFTIVPSTAPFVFAYRWANDETSAARGQRAFIALRTHRPSHPTERCQIRIIYFQGRPGHPAAQDEPEKKPREEKPQ